MNSLRSILTELLGTTVWEAVAVLLAIAYLVLAVRRSLWCWLCGLLSSVIYFVVMARSGLVMDALLQIYYVIMSVYGYVEWRRGQSSSGEVTVVTWSWRNHALVILVVVTLTAINAWGLRQLSPWLLALSHKFGMSYVQVVRSPWLDSFVTWGSVLTTWMVARRVLENWLYWIVVDGIGAYLYYSRGLVATAGLFVVYVLMVIYGYCVWRKRTSTSLLAELPA